MNILYKTLLIFVLSVAVRYLSLWVFPEPGAVLGKVFMLSTLVGAVFSAVLLEWIGVFRKKSTSKR